MALPAISNDINIVETLVLYIYCLKNNHKTTKSVYVSTVQGVVFLNNFSSCLADLNGKELNQLEGTTSFMVEK